MRHWLIMLIIMANAQLARGQFAIFDSLSEQDVTDVVEEFSTNLVHTSVTPPTSLGKDFGVEVSVIGGVTESPKINEITKRESPDTEVPYIPHGWLLLSVSVPYGISFEVNYIPEVDVDGLNLSHTSGAVKWSITDQFFKGLPFDWAVRTYVSSSEISFSQTLNDTPAPGQTSNVAVGYENSMVGADTSIGFDFGVVEPYVGLGWVNSDAELSALVTTSFPYSIFDEGGERRSLSRQSTRFLAGMQLQLPLLKFSLEYSHVFSVSRYSAKVGLAF